MFNIFITILTLYFCFDFFIFNDNKDHDFITNNSYNKNYLLICLTIMYKNSLSVLKEDTCS